MGVLWALGLFLCCLRIWYNDLHYRSRFESASRVHRFLDVTGYFLLVYAAANIEPVHEYMREGSPQLGIFLIVITCAQGLWLMRWLEIAVFSRDEESRRFSALRLVDDGPVLIWWLLAWLNFNRSLDGVHAYGVPVCLIIGAYWTDIRLNVRVHRMAILRGCDPDGEVRHIPKERTRVPMNVEFAIHRLNEFMMLMVGEGVLQLVINKTTEWTNHPGWNASLVSGFVLSLALLYSWNVTEPHHQTGHAFARSSRPAAFYLLIAPLNAFAVLSAGIGIKIVLSTPTVRAKHSHTLSFILQTV